jgi:SSS family transporter
MPINVDLTLVGLYLAAMLGVGFFASRKIKDNLDFSIAGRGIGFFLLLGTLVGTTIGAASTLGKAGKAMEFGVAVFFATLAYPTGLFLFGLMAPAIRRTRIWSITDALHQRYGKGIKLAFGITLVLSVTSMFGTQLLAVGLTLTSILGETVIGHTQIILITGAVMILYTVMGGLVAVAYTDFIQSLIMVVSIGLLLPGFILADVGTAVALDYVTPQPGRFWGGLSPVYVVSIFLIDLPFCLIDPSLWQRAAAAENPAVIRKAMFLTSGVYVYWSFVVVFLGIAAFHFFPDLAKASHGVDGAIPRLIVHYMPVGLKGICMAGMMAVMMSTASAVLLIAGTSFSRDIFQTLRPETDERTALTVSRIFIVIIGILGVYFALNMKGIFDLILMAFAIFVSGAFVPTLAALFWEKATKAGAIVSSITASVAVVGLYGLKIARMLPTWIEPVMVSIPLSFILMVVISRMTFNPETATPRLIDREEAES